MTLTVKSLQSVGFGMLIEQVSCGANVMLIGPQENVCQDCQYRLNLLVSQHLTKSFSFLSCLWSIDWCIKSVGSTSVMIQKNG